MKINYFELEQVSNALKQIVNKDLSIQTCLKLIKITDVLSKDFNPFKEMEKRIVKKYYDKEKKNVPDDKMEAYNTEMKELLEQEIEIDIEPIHISYLEKEGIKFKPSIIGLLHNYGFIDITEKK